MKTFLYWSLVAVLASAFFVMAVLHYNREDSWQPQNFLASRGRRWILSGDQHLFEVTERAFNLASLDGFKEGCRKWVPVGGPASPLKPHFVTPQRNVLIGEDEFVLGVLNSSTATAYPLRVLVSHQVINDVTQEPHVLAYFGQTNHTAAAYVSTTRTGAANFGSTGFLYRQSDLLFDFETESLFLPPTGVFVAGKRLGERLELLPSAVVTLSDWLTLFPESRIMTTNTGSMPRAYEYFDMAAEPPAVRTARKGFEGRLSGAHTDVVALREGWDAVSVLLGDRQGWRPGEYGIEFQGADYTVHLGQSYGSAWVEGPGGVLSASLRSHRYIFNGAVPDAGNIELP